MTWFLIIQPWLENPAAVRCLSWPYAPIFGMFHCHLNSQSVSPELKNAPNQSGSVLKPLGESPRGRWVFVFRITLRWSLWEWCRIAQQKNLREVWPYPTLGSRNRRNSCPWAHENRRSPQKREGDSGTAFFAAKIQQCSGPGAARVWHQFWQFWHFWQLAHLDILDFRISCLVA